MTERRDQIRDLSISTHDRRAGIFIAPVDEPRIARGYKSADSERARWNLLARMCLILLFLVPQRGFEPLTHALRMRCSTN
jgi:hypothetical protein